MFPLKTIQLLGYPHGCGTPPPEISIASGSEKPIGPIIGGRLSELLQSLPGEQGALWHLAANRGKPSPTLGSFHGGTPKWMVLNGLKWMI